MHVLLPLLLTFAAVATLRARAEDDQTDAGVRGSVLVTRYLEPDLDLTSVAIAPDHEVDISAVGPARQRLVVRPLKSNTAFSDTTLFRAGATTEAMVYGPHIPPGTYTLATRDNDHVGATSDAVTVEFIRNRVKRSVHDLVGNSIDGSGLGGSAIPDMTYIWRRATGESGTGCVVITPHRHKEVTSRTLATIGGSFQPEAIFEWSKKCAGIFTAPATTNVVIIRPEQTMSGRNGLTFHAGATTSFVADGDTIPDHAYKLAVAENGDIVGKANGTELRLTREAVGSRYHAASSRTIIRYDWRTGDGNAGRGRLRPLPPQPGTITLRVGEPTILTVDVARDMDDGCEYRWQSEAGAVIGSGRRVNFIPTVAGIATVQFAAYRDGARVSTFHFRLPVTPPRERIVFDDVRHMSDRLIVKGHVENLANIADYRIAAYRHSDLYYAIPGKHIFSMDQNGHFAFVAETKPDADRLVVMLIHKHLDPDDESHCFTVRNGTRTHGACTGVYDQFYNTKARLPFSVNGDDVLAFETYHFLGSERHPDPQMQYLLNRFCKVQVQFKNTSPTVIGAIPDPDAPPNARLIRSYNNHDQVYLYDQALAILAFAHAGEQAAARRILDALSYLQLKAEDNPENPRRDGSWYFSHLPDGKCIYPDSPSWHEREQGVWDRHGYDDRRVTGAIAWTAMAINAYHMRYPEEFADTAYGDMHDRVMRYLARLQTDVDFAGIRSRPVRFQDNDRKITGWNEAETFSIEHNLDTYSAFRIYADLTADAKYALRAAEVLRFIESMWIGENQGFYVGFGNDGAEPNAGEIFMDPQSWGLLSVGHRRELLQRYKTGLKRIYEQFFEPAGFVSLNSFKPADPATFANGGFCGFVDYFPAGLDITDTARQYAWTEGTLGVILAMQLVAENGGEPETFRRYGVTYSADDLLESMNRLQDADGGVPYATWNAIPDDFSHEPCIAGTAWLYFANHRFNPFAPRYTTSPVFELVVDNFDTGKIRGKSFERQTTLAQSRDRSDIYHGVSVARPDFAIMSKEPSDADGGSGLMLKLDYEVTSNGWAAYYSLLGDADITPYDALRFLVRGAGGGENFDIGFRDSGMQRQKHDAVSVGPVSLFLQDGVKTTWQEVLIPLCLLDAGPAGHLDKERMGSLVFQFRDAEAGTIYVDDISFVNLPEVPHGYLCDLPQTRRIPVAAALTPLRDTAHPPLEVVSRFPSFPSGQEKTAAGRGTFGVFKFGKIEAWERPRGTYETWFDPNADTIANDPAFAERLRPAVADTKSTRVDYLNKHPEKAADGGQPPTAENFVGVYSYLLADLSEYNTMTFLVKGKEGGENFIIGVADAVANEQLTNIPAGTIYRYLETGITTDWQVVKIPLADFTGVDLRCIVSLTFDFKEPGGGTIWVDELAFTTDDLVNREQQIMNRGFLLVDDFNYGSLNNVGTTGAVFSEAPAMCSAERIGAVATTSTPSLPSKYLALRFDSREPGWCGYYTMLNRAGGAYFDMSGFGALSFAIRGGSGNENLDVKLADKHRQQYGNPGNAGPIATYLPGGVTTSWQTVTIPLTAFGPLDLTETGTLTMQFAPSTTGTVYVDDIRLLVTAPPPPEPAAMETAVSAKPEVDPPPVMETVPAVADQSAVTGPAPTAITKGQLYVDTFEMGDRNLLGGTSAVTTWAPSNCSVARIQDTQRDKGETVLQLEYTKADSGWCGYFSILSEDRDVYADISAYDALAFRVRGKRGDEDFEIKLADRQWRDVGNPNSAGQVGDYLAEGMTRDWQDVVIPLVRFGPLDLSEISSFSINFNKLGAGTVYIDDIRFVTSPSVVNGGVDSLPSVTVTTVVKTAQARHALVLDDFETAGFNRQGGLATVFNKAPSECLATIAADAGDPERGQVLQLDYNKEQDGYCGFYSRLTSSYASYYDLSDFDYVVFDIKGTRAGGDIEVKMADLKWDETGNPDSAGRINDFLENGLTQDWQRVRIPLEKFGMLDRKKMCSLSFVISDVGSGRIFLDNIAFLTSVPDNPM